MYPSSDKYFESTSSISDIIVIVEENIYTV